MRWSLGPPYDLAVVEHQWAHAHRSPDCRVGQTTTSGWGERRSADDSGWVLNTGTRSAGPPGFAFHFKQCAFDLKPFSMLSGDPFRRKCTRSKRGTRNPMGLRSLVDVADLTGNHNRWALQSRMRWSLGTPYDLAVVEHPWHTPTVRQIVGWVKRPRRGGVKDDRRTISGGC